MYRVQQFIWAISTAFKKVDYKFISKYLDRDEVEVFKRLKVSEQHHSIRVCNDAFRISKKYNNGKVDKNRLGKMALLHDVGKSEKPLNVIDKSMIVILDKLSKGRLRKHCNIAKIDSYYNHPKKSVSILSELKGYDKDFLEVIGRHHEKINEEENLYLKIIKESDDLN
ncbi:MAG: HD domain-containing protein [Clostridium sp.]|uniref:HD domain-containing protein n=1 Tax=Clostridium sp. TaxID=1506 RepID=UPI003EE6B9CA